MRLRSLFFPYVLAYRLLHEITAFGYILFRRLYSALFVRHPYFDITLLQDDTIHDTLVYLIDAHLSYHAVEWDHFALDYGVDETSPGSKAHIVVKFYDRTRNHTDFPSLPQSVETHMISLLDKGPRRSVPFTKRLDPFCGRLIRTTHHLPSSSGHTTLKFMALYQSLIQTQDTPHALNTL